MDLDLALLTFFVGYIFFCVPLLLGLKCKNNVIFTLNQRAVLRLLFLGAFVPGFFFLRVNYKIGIPDEPSSLPFSGLIFTLRRLSIYILSLGLFSHSKVASFLFFTVCAALCLPSNAWWRSGVNEMLITFFAVYFFNRGGKVHCFRI